MGKSGDRDHDPVVHVGFPKTGTKWLQWRIFSSEKYGFREVCPDLAVGIRELVLPSSLTFDAAEAYAVFEPDIIAAKRAGLVPVLSNEYLCGGPSPWEYEGESVAQRIKAMFPDARILISVREQRSFILSFYRQFVRWGGTRSLGAFVNDLSAAFEEGRRAPLGLDYLRFDDIVRCYQDLFGEENVLVVPFELLRDDQTKFVNRILEFSGLPLIDQCDEPWQNISESVPTLVVRKNLNRLMKPIGGNAGVAGRGLFRLMRAVNRLVPASTRRSYRRDAIETISTAVAGRYRESNSRLQDFVSDDLERYGYEM